MVENQRKGDSSGIGWGIWLLVLLFPIPFSPWWLGVICFLAFASLVYLVSRRRRT